MTFKKPQSQKFALTMECWVLSILLGTGCASIGKNGGDAAYHESAFNDLNKAPQRFTPPASEGDISKDGDSPAHRQARADYYFTMGESYALEGNSRKALEAYKTVLLYDTDSPTVHLRLAVELVKLGMTSEAINHCEAALRMDEKRVDAHLLLGGLYSSVKAFDGAIKQYERAVALDPENKEAPLYLGAVYAEQKNYKKALEYFTRLAKDEDYKNRYLVEYYSGRVYQEMKLIPEAEAAYRRALELKTDSYEALIALGGLLDLQGKKEQEIALYLKFQKENGPNEAIASALAQIFLANQDYNRALEQLLLLEELGEDILSVKVKIALIYVEQKSYDRAVAKLEETLNMAPESDKVRFYLAALFEEMKKPDQALKYFQEIPSQSNFFSESAIHAAFILKQKGNLEAAANVLEKAMDEKPETPQMFSLYAVVMDARNEFDKARLRLEQGLQRFPENAQLLFYYGTVQDKLGNREAMVKNLKKVIALDPKHSQALNYLAYTYAEDSANLSEAESLARQALKWSPNDPFIMDTLGWVLFKQGRIKEALPLLESAHSQQPQESVIADHLGDAYIQYRLPDKARQMYRRAMELESDLDRQKKIESKITSIDVLPVGPRIPASAGESERQRNGDK